MSRVQKILCVICTAFITFYNILSDVNQAWLTTKATAPSHNYTANRNETIPSSPAGIKSIAWPMTLIKPILANEIAAPSIPDKQLRNQWLNLPKKQLQKTAKAPNGSNLSGICHSHFEGSSSFGQLLKIVNENKTGPWKSLSTFKL